jgi:hypothetical protein
MATPYSMTLVKAFCMERQFKARTERHRHLWRRRSFELTLRAKARRRGASNIRVEPGANERPSTRFRLFP